MHAEQGERKVAFIMGAGKGSGLGCFAACAFARAGWDLVLAGRSKSRLRDAAHDVQQLGANALVLPLELGRDGGEQAAERAVQQVLERFGRIDALVNASQAAKVGDSLEHCKPADLELALDSGVYAAFLLMRACFEPLRESGGTVVNLTSAGAAAGQEGLALLAASKEGLRGLSRVAAAEWERHGIAVHCIDPQVASPAWLKWATEYTQTAAGLAASASSAVSRERESSAGVCTADTAGAKAASGPQLSAEDALHQLSAALETPESFATRCVNLCTQ
ncbi:MAG: SDR family NAD(P)-dependent oxidoreductase [Coriobacteriales bacterium]